MDNVSVGHIALFVPDLQQAERFYQHVFGMQLLMREAEMDDHLWYTLPTDKGWADAETAGIELGMVALRRDALVLALFEGRPVPEETVLEIGICMTAQQIAAVHGRLPDNVKLVGHEHGDIMFRDPYGYLWHLWPAGKVFRSNGESSGRWISLQ